MRKLRRLRGDVMVRMLWGLLVGAALVAVRGETAAQESLPPAGPVTVTTLPHPPLPEAACLPGGAPACAPFEDCNGPLLKGDPLLDGRILLFVEEAPGLHQGHLGGGNSGVAPPVERHPFPDT